MLATEYNQSERTERIKAMRQRTGQMDRERTYWTEDDKETLKALFSQNVGITEIALILQRTEVAVMQQIQSLNLYEKVRRQSAKKQEGCLCKYCTLQPSCDLRKCLLNSETDYITSCV